MVALFKVDAAYGEVMGSADGQLKSWRQTVGAGRIVPDFGERVRECDYTSRVVVHVFLGGGGALVSRVLFFY